MMAERGARDEPAGRDAAVPGDRQGAVPGDRERRQRPARRTRRTALAVLQSEIREDVQALLQQWLHERAGTLGLEMAHLLSGYLGAMQKQHAAAVARLQAEHARQVAELREGRPGRSEQPSEELAAAMEEHYRQRLERLQAELDAVARAADERVREAVARERERASAREHDLQDRLAEREQELARLRRDHQAEVAVLKRVFDQELASRDRRLRQLESERPGRR